MRQELPHCALLIELDVIFDTRLGIIAQHWPEKMAQVLMAGYYNRICEKFPGIPFEEFNKKYAERDKVTLSKSTRTKFSKVIMDFCLGLEENALSTPYKYKPKLIVNTWPYELTESEEVLIIRGLVAITEGKMDVALIKKTYHELTPEWLDKNCAMFSLYRYPDWMEIQFGELWEKLPNTKKKTIPEITLLAPFTSYRDMTQVPADFFKNMDEAKGYMSFFVGLQWLPVEVVCPFFQLPELNEYLKAKEKA